MQSISNNIGRVRRSPDGFDLSVMPTKTIVPGRFPDEDTNVKGVKKGNDEMIFRQ